MESSGRRDADRCCHRVNLEDAVLSDTSQMQKDKHWAIPLPEVPGGVRSIATEGGVRGQGLGRGQGVSVLWAELQFRR